MRFTALVLLFKDLVHFKVATVSVANTQPWSSCYKPDFNDTPKLANQGWNKIFTQSG